MITYILVITGIFWILGGWTTYWKNINPNSSVPDFIVHMLIWPFKSLL